jgi:hypothetical protein
VRILLSCLQALRPRAIPAYEFWRNYFVRGCEEAGIDWVEVPGVDWAEGLALPPGEPRAAWRARTWDAVLDFVRDERRRRPFDLFLGYLYPAQVEPGAVAELQRIGIPCVNFFCDNVREFRRVPAEYGGFALHWVPELEALPMYRDAGLPHVHAPMPCWVPPSYREPPVDETEPPTFIGSADVLRRHLLGHAMDCARDLVVRGPGWTSEAAAARGKAWQRPFRWTLTNQVHLLRTSGWLAFAHKLTDILWPLPLPAIDPARVWPPVFGDDYFRTTREAAVTVGVNRVPTYKSSSRRPLAYSRLRDIEAPMLGACYLTEWTAGLQELYEIGTEVECYRTPDELCSKLEELVKDKSRRRSMRERAQRRALTEHSVSRSLHRIRERLGS